MTMAKAGERTNHATAMAEMHLLQKAGTSCIKLTLRCRQPTSRRSLCCSSYAGNHQTNNRKKSKN